LLAIAYFAVESNERVKWMKGKEYRYFVNGNTARGYYNLLSSNIEGLQVIVLEGPPYSGQKEILQAIRDHWLNQGMSVECIFSAMNPNELVGVIQRDQLVGFLDGTLQMRFPLPAEKISRISLYDALDKSHWLQLAPKLEEIHKEIEESCSQAYRAFGEALTIHDEWEDIYISHLDFEEANRLTEQWIQRLFPEPSHEKKGSTVHRFLGAATPYGPVDFIPNLTDDVPHRYYIKGRPGSGKSTMLKKVVSYAEKLGYDVEVYHCGLDPYSLDMVMVRELNFTIFDSTAPHEYFPSRKGDEIIEFYGTVIAPTTDETYKDELADIISRYKEKMDEGTKKLWTAKEKWDEWKNYIEKVINTQKVEEIQQQIRNQWIG
jgi:hypothetical protein